MAENSIPISQIRKPLAGDIPIAKALDPRVKEGTLYEKLDDDRVKCHACGHYCKISPNARGICQVRYNVDGKLYAPWGYVVALQCDPTEKKPFYHIYPGSDTLTFGMLGCDMHCSFCQNWDISQTMRDGRAGRPITEITPQEMVALAKRNHAKCIASSYNEPLITTEWAVDIFKEAKQAGLTCLYISNGNASREALEYLKPYVSGYNIDLKTMQDKIYRKLGATLQAVQDLIKMVHDMGIFTEVITLIVPGMNDPEDELRDAAKFIKSVSPDIPWHVTAFHPDYKMQDRGATPASKIIRAAEIGYEEGLHFVYGGNAAGRVDKYEHTYCPGCHKKLIDRYAYLLRDYQITDDSTCPDCGTKIAGLWPAQKEVKTGTMGDLFFRHPRRPR